MSFDNAWYFLRNIYFDMPAQHQQQYKFISYNIESNYTKSRGQDMRIVRIVFIWISATMLIASCKHHAIEEEYRPMANLKITIDWSDTGFNPDNDPNQNVYGASAWFFPKDGANAGRAIEFKMENSRGQTVELPVGHYSVIIFNNTINDYSTIGFRGVDAYNTFEACALTAKAKFSTHSKFPINGSSILEPELLAAWSVDEFEVKLPTGTDTSNPNNSSIDAVENLLDLKPRLLISTIQVVAHAKGLSNAKSALGKFSGLPSSVFLSSGKNSSLTVNQSFTFTSRSYTNGSSTDGYIKGIFRTFGKIPDTSTDQYELQIDFILNDNKTNGPYNFKVNHLNYIIEVGNNQSSDDSVISIPVANGGEGGFDFGLSDWGKEKNLPVNV